MNRERSNLTFGSILRRGILVCVVMVTLAAEFSISDARADNWMFRRSYYSHVTPKGVPDNVPRPRLRSAYRPAYVGMNPGFSIRGGYRFNRMVINSGNSSDTTYFRQNWFEISP